MQPQSALKLLCPRLLALLEAKDRGAEKCDFRPAEIFAVSSVPPPGEGCGLTHGIGHDLSQKIPHGHAQGTPSNMGEHSTLLGTIQARNEMPHRK